jgi:hypothetical protein
MSLRPNRLVWVGNRDGGALGVATAKIGAPGSTRLKRHCEPAVASKPAQ